MTDHFFDVMKNRRSIYQIGGECTVSDDRLIELVEDAVIYTPTAFHSQSGRVILLLGEHHQTLWDITEDTLRKLVPSQDSFASTEAKLNSFRSGYGTILFFEDQGVVNQLQNQFPLYKEHFPVWSEQASGILQFILWCSLEVEGMGASLQHYNPLIDEAVKSEWKVLDNWKLVAQMPFGTLAAPAEERSFLPLAERVKIIR
ncbi:MAG: nitroreductase [Oscillospiraceae bacterium]|nr:nitroreductase [Oscillospiraceae bacterium]